MIDKVTYVMDAMGSVNGPVNFAYFYRAMLCIRGTSLGPVSVSVHVGHKSVFYRNG